MSKLDRYYQTIPSIYNPKNNTVNGALVQAWAQEDEGIATEIINANEQLFVATAVNGYLTNLGLNVDVPRPLYVALSDVYYRDLIYAVSYAPKQVRKTMYDVLDVFWGPTYSRANVNSNNAQNYNFGGDSGLTGTLTFTKNGNTVVGQGTLFTTELAVGDYIKITGQNNSTFNKVVNIINNTTLVVEDKFLNSTITATARAYSPKILTIKIDNDPQIDLVVIPKYISNLGAATAEEISSALNGNGSNSTASSTRKDLTTNRYVNLRTNTTGSFGQIQVIGGTANVILNFPTTINTIDTLQFNTVIYEINPREIVLKIPRLVAKLTRSLRGAIHINNPIKGDILTVNNTSKLMTQNISQAVTLNQLAAQNFLLNLSEARVTTHAAGQDNLTVNFEPGSDLSTFPFGSKIIPFQNSSNPTIFNHKANEQFLNFNFFDNNGINIFPMSYTATNANSSSVNFSGSQSGKFIYKKPDYLHTQSVASTTWTVTHNLAISGFYPTVTTYNAANNWFMADVAASVLTIDSTNALHVTFTVPATGHVSINRPDYIFTQSSFTDTLDITHNLGSDNLIISVYFLGFLYPSHDYTISVINDNMIRVKLSAPTSLAVVSITKVENAVGRYSNPNYLNSFIFNPNANFYPSKRRTILKSQITSGTNPVKITVDDSSHIPNSPGHLIFNFGKNNEEILIPYVGRPNNSTIVLDSSYIFSSDHSLNEIINYIPEAKGYDPRDDGSDYAAYITDTKKAVEVVQDIIGRIKAVGVVLRWIIKYPEYNFNCCDDC